MPYAVENAMYQWRDGERRLREVEEPRKRALERTAAEIVDELRRRLGSTFTLGELADLYAGGGMDWASDMAQERFVGTESAVAVDAAFARYAREAADYAGGRQRDPHRAGD